MALILKKTSRAAALAALALAVAGCGADHATYKVGNRVFAAGETPPSGARAGGPAVDVAGRWTLASTAGGSCAVTLSGGPGAAEGSIKPEGGCPGKLYTSRTWSLQQGALVIQDHTGAQLAQLNTAGPGRFEGRAATDGQVSLSR